MYRLFLNAHITTGEVASLQHELRDDSVELAALVAVSLLASAQSSEVLGSLGNNIVVEGEVDATFLGCDITRQQVQWWGREQQRGQGSQVQHRAAVR